MIKSIRIHNTSDGGTMDIGASDKSVIEVNGVRLSLAKLVELGQNAGAMVEIGNRGGTLTFTPHRCPEPPAPAVVEPDPAPRRRRAAAE